MFEDARNDIIDALEESQQPVPVEDVRQAVEGGELVAESALNQYATTTDHDGETYVTAVENGPSYTVNDIGAEGSDDDSSARSQSAPEPEQVRDDQQPPAEAQTASASADAASWSADADLDLYEVNGLVITTNPEEALVGEPTGEDWNGIPVLTNGHDGIPNQTTPYFPVEVEPGNRDTEQWMGRVLGHQSGDPRPLLFEGEAGTGKNSAIARMATATNRITQRTNFGNDVTVFDLVGEKDFHDDGSYYVLGDQAKAAMFGHVAIWDEVNMVTGSTSSFLHGLAEKPGNRSLELRGTGVTLTDIPVSDDEIERYGSWYEAARQKWTPEDHLGKYIHPEFRVTATCNPLDYADTKDMNAAFRDRFTVVEHTHLTTKREAALLAEQTGADPSDIRPLVEVANILREARAKASKHQTPITHRALEKTVEVAGAGEDFMSFRAAALNVIVDHASTKQDKQYIHDTIEDEL